MGGTRIARGRVAELKKKISHAEEKKKEFSDYLKNLKQKYRNGEISYSTFLETFYQKRNGLNIQEWVSHFDDYIKECRKEISKERRVLFKTNLAFIFASLVLISILIIFLTNFQPKILGFTIEDGTQTGNQGEIPTETSEIPLGEPTGETPETTETPTTSPEITAEIPKNIPEETINKSNSEEIKEEVLNESSPSHQTGQEQEPLLPSENETQIEIPINETEIIEENITEIINETIFNETLTNETILTSITNETLIVNFTDRNLTIQTTQFQAVLNQPVKWISEVTSENPINGTIAIPIEAENVIVTAITSENEENSFAITGAIIGTNKENWLFKILNKIFGRITGNVVGENQNSQESEIKIEINESVEKYEVEYFTDAPYAIETEKNNGKEVKISGPENLHYENVLAYTDLNENFQ